MPTTADVPEFRAGQTEISARALNKMLGVTTAVGQDKRVQPLVYRPRQILVETQDDIDAGKLGNVKIIGYDADSNTFKEYSDAFEAFNLGPANAPAGARTPLTLGEGQIQFFNYFTSAKDQSSSSSSSVSSTSSENSGSSVVGISSSSSSSSSSSAGLPTENSIAVFDAAGNVKEADAIILALQRIRGVDWQMVQDTTVTCFIQAHSNLGADRAQLIFDRSRGTSGARLAILSGDDIAFLRFRGHNGAAFVNGMGILVEAAENYTGIANGTRITFQATDVGDTVLSNYLRFDGDGETVDVLKALEANNTIEAAGGFIDDGDAGLDGVIQGGETFSGGIITGPGVAFTSAFHVRQTSPQLLSSGALIDWTSAEYDRNSDVDLSADKFIAPVAGIYHFYAQVTIDVGATPGTVTIQIHKEGFVFRKHLVGVPANVTMSVFVAADITLDAEDEVTVFWGAPAGADSTTGNPEETFFGGSGPLP